MDVAITEKCSYLSCRPLDDVGHWSNPMVPENGLMLYSHNSYWILYKRVDLDKKDPGEHCSRTQICNFFSFFFLFYSACASIIEFYISLPVTLPSQLPANTKLICLSIWLLVYIVRTYWDVGERAGLCATDWHVHTITNKHKRILILSQPQSRSLNAVAGLCL